MEQNNEQEKCKFMENLEKMREHGICLKVSTADVQFGDDEPVLVFHLACIGQLGGQDLILMHGMCRKASGLQKTMKEIACITAELCRICKSKKIIGGALFEEEEIARLIKVIMRENNMEVEQLCHPQEAPEQDSWMYN